MTADGTNDEYIQPQGFTHYSFWNTALAWLPIQKNVFKNAYIQCKIYHRFFCYGIYTLF